MLQPALRSNFPVRILCGKECHKLIKWGAVQKPMPVLPGGWGPPMLSVTVKTIASRGGVQLFLSYKKMFMPAKVNAFMASIY